MQRVTSIIRFALRAGQPGLCGALIVPINVLMLLVASTAVIGTVLTVGKTISKERWNGDSYSKTQLSNGWLLQESRTYATERYDNSSLGWHSYRSPTSVSGHVTPLPYISSEYISGWGSKFARAGVRRTVSLPQVFLYSLALVFVSFMWAFRCRKQHASH